MKISLSLSSHLIDTEFKVGNDFPETFGVLTSFSSTSKFALELLDAFLSLVILYVTFFFM